MRFQLIMAQAGPEAFAKKIGETYVANKIESVIYLINFSNHDIKVGRQNEYSKYSKI